MDLGTLTSTDEDGDTPITFHIDGAAGKFTVDETSGAVSVADVDVLKDPGAARAKLGYVPEEPALYDYLTWPYSP